MTDPARRLQAQIRQRIGRYDRAVLAASEHGDLAVTEEYVALLDPDISLCDGGAGPSPTIVAPDTTADAYTPAATLDWSDDDLILAWAELAGDPAAHDQIMATLEWREQIAAEREPPDTPRSPGGSAADKGRTNSKMIRERISRSPARATRMIYCGGTPQRYSDAVHAGRKHHCSELTRHEIRAPTQGRPHPTSQPCGRPGRYPSDGRIQPADDQHGQSTTDKLSRDVYSARKLGRSRRSCC